MGRSQETFNKKEVRKNKEKKRKEKEKKKLAKKEGGKSSLDDMIAYVDEYGNIVSEKPDPRSKQEVEAEEIEVSVPKADPSMKPDPVRTGRVTYFNESKGYGFIKDSETGENVFVHVNNLIDRVQEGSKVTFEIGPGQKGPAATAVKLAES